MAPDTQEAEGQVRAEPFHVRARKRMAELSLRQRDLIKQTGLHRNTVSSILNGRRPSRESEEKIIAALGLDGQR